MRPNFTMATVWAMMVCTLMGCDGDEPPPKDVAQDFLDALYLEDFEEARKLSTSSSDPTIIMLEWMKHSADDSDMSFVKGNPPKVKKCEIEDGRATCIYCCGLEGEDIAITLIRESGTWKADLTESPSLPEKEQ